MVLSGNVGGGYMWTRLTDASSGDSWCLRWPTGLCDDSCVAGRSAANPDGVASLVSTIETIKALTAYSGSIVQLVH